MHLMCKRYLDKDNKYRAVTNAISHTHISIDFKPEGGGQS